MNLSSSLHPRDVMLKLWGTPIKLSYDFVKTTALNEYYLMGSDISEIIENAVVPPYSEQTQTSDYLIKRETYRSFMRRILLFFSDSYKDKIEDKYTSIINLLLQDDKGQHEPNITISLVRIYRFLDLYTFLFSFNDRVIFESYEELEELINYLYNTIQEKLEYLLITYNLSEEESTIFTTHVATFLADLENFLKQIEEDKELGSMTKIPTALRRLEEPSFFEPNVRRNITGSPKRGNITPLRFI